MRLVHSREPPAGVGRRDKVVPMTSAADPDFAAQWNSLDKGTRRQIRRLIRVGRPQENAENARFAVRFAAYQRTRPWSRYFWLWLLPLFVGGFYAGAQIHPIVIGVVGGLAANAVLVRWNFSRTPKVNAALLDS